MRDLLHELQVTFAQRMQWWRRRKSVKSTEHTLHPVTSVSGIPTSSVTSRACREDFVFTPPRKS